MIVINPLNLKVPVHARVGRIKARTTSNQNTLIVYFSGRRFEWIQTQLTPILAEDLARIFKTPNITDWINHDREVEIFSQDGFVRARNYAN